MEIEIAGFDRERRTQHEATIRQHRRDLEDVKRQINSEQQRHIQLKNRETLMGAGSHFEDAVS